MKIFFWSYRNILMVGFILLILLGIGLVAGERTDLNLSMAANFKTTEPIYQGNKEESKMALTFNVDWGEEYIEGILSVLDAHQVKATFFITGRWAKKFPDLTKKIAEASHEIGNHGFSHPHPDQISKEKNQQEILETEKEINKSTGRKTVLFAPPYGEHGTVVLQAASELGYKTILWTIDTVDWDKSRTTEIIRAKVADKAEKGAIVLMHPTDRTLKALPLILQNLKEKNFSLVTVTEVLN
ncbi:MAG: polysaccharide deacetylase family protein [Bacillota bacterium]